MRRLMPLFCRLLRRPAAPFTPLQHHHQSLSRPRTALEMAMRLAHCRIPRMNVLVYDIEIKNAVPPRNEADRLPEITYCEGWHDKAGMGIACITAYDIARVQPRIFMADNLAAFEKLVSERDAVLGFNNHRFDDRLLEASGIAIAEGKSIDIAALIWRAAGIPEGEHPHGIGLDALCQANRLPGKSGDGAMAPVLYQTGRIGELIDYCLTDTLRTLQLYRYLQWAGGCKDPRNGNWLNVMVPR